MIQTFSKKNSCVLHFIRFKNMCNFNPMFFLFLYFENPVFQKRPFNPMFFLFLHFENPAVQRRPRSVFPWSVILTSGLLDI
jgi:hypothetical protein